MSLEYIHCKNAIEYWEYLLNGGTYWWDKDVYSNEHILSQIEFFKKRLELIKKNNHV